MPVNLQGNIGACSIDVFIKETKADYIVVE